MNRDSLARRALVGVVYIGVLVLGAGLLVAQSQGVFAHKVEVIGKFASVGDGLPIGSDVKLHGVIVGRVAAVNASPGDFEVQMDLKPAFVGQIPAAVEARILPTNLFGAPFVDLRVVGAQQPAIRAGAKVPEDLSAGSVQMQSVFQKVYDVLVAVKPAKLSMTLSAIAGALRGNGELIGHMIERADRYVSMLNSHAGVFKDDLTLLASTLEGVAKAAPDLLSSMDDVSSLARVIVKQHAQLQAVFAAAIHTSDFGSSFIQAQGARIVRYLEQTEKLSGILAPSALYIDRSLVALGATAGRFASIAPGATGAHIRGYLVTTAFPTYTAADCPRYGALAGPNCAGAHRARTVRGNNLRPAPDFGGTVGSVGSPQEQSLAGRLAGMNPTADNALATLLVGPVVRGGTVVDR